MTTPPLLPRSRTLGASIALGLVVILPAFISGPANAEATAGFTAPEKKPTVSPFDFVKSGAKAAREKKAEADDPSGSKVIGGQIAADGAWPWQVAMLWSGGPVAPESQFCGGSIVLDQWVLTAAHCVHMADDQGVGHDLAPGDFGILVGTNRLDGSGDLVPVEAVFRHPSYSADQMDYDIALVKLARKPNAAYKTIEIPDTAFGDILRQPGITTVVTGWGLQNGANLSPELRQAQIQMLDRDMCNTAMLDILTEEAAPAFMYAVNTMSVGEDDAYALWDQMIAKAPIPLSTNMICSGTFEGGKTSCNGDSGGPLVVPLEDGSYIQAGVVSWGLSSSAGRGCEETAMFSTYTDVSQFVPWLNETIASAK